MSDHNNDDHFQEDRKLTGDGSFVSKAAEGAGDEDRKDRDNNTGNNFQNDSGIPPEALRFALPWSR